MEILYNIVNPTPPLGLGLVALEKFKEIIIVSLLLLLCR